MQRAGYYQGCMVDRKYKAPAAMLPSIAKSNGARVIEINPTGSSYTNSITELFLQGPAGEVSRLMDSYLF